MKKKLEIFQKLLNSVKANCPGLITEDIENQFNQEFDDAISSVQNDAYQSGLEQGQKDGFQEGYEEAKRIADENLKVETDKIIAQCDDQAVQKITEILQAVDDANTEKLDVVYSMVKEYQAELEARKAELEAMDTDHAEKLGEVQDYYEGQLAAQDADAANKLQMYAEAVDRKHAKQLKTIFEAVSADHAKKLNECIDFIDKKHAKQLKMLCESIDADHAKKLHQIVESINNDHAKKLQLLVESIDADHAKKLQTIVENIDRNHTKKLQTIVESIDKDHTQKLQNAIQHERSKKVEILSESIEKYLDYALEKSLPKKNLVVEQKYNVAMKTLDKMKDYLKVNGIIQESKNGIFTDYENQINAAKEKSEKLISENAKLNRKLQRKEAQLVLQEKLKDCTPAQAKYLRAHFARVASPKVIQESIEDARKSFRKEQAAKRAKVQAELRAKRTASTQPSSIVLQNKEKESKKVQTTAQKTPDNIAEFYANYLKKQN